MKDRVSQQAEARLGEIMAQYPEPKSAMMYGLYLAQEEFGVLDQRAVNWLSARLDAAPAHIWEIITFYSLYYKHPVGRYHFQVCRTLSCELRGSRAIVEYLKQRFGLKAGEVSADGLWSYEEVECLGSCGTAPVCQINDCYFENLTPEKIGEIVDRISRVKPDLRLSTLKDSLGEGLKGYSKSEIL